MRRTATASLLLLFVTCGWGQTLPQPRAAAKSQSSGAKAGTAKPPAVKPKPAAPAPPAANPVAVIETAAGNLTCTLFRDKTPNSVANFIGLAIGTKDWTDLRTGQTKHGVPLYDGTIFHRVIPEFMIQGGDPLGNGQGGPGYRLPDEFVPDLKYDQPGRLAYANSGPNTNGSQFFITEVERPRLDPCLDDAGCERGGQMRPKGYGYTIFGQCTRSRSSW